MVRLSGRYSLRRSSILPGGRDEARDHARTVPGSLTENGVLYEGSDFEAWKERVAPMIDAEWPAECVQIMETCMDLTDDQIRELMLQDKEALKATNDENGTIAAPARAPVEQDMPLDTLVPTWLSWVLREFASELQSSERLRLDLEVILVLAEMGRLESVESIYMVTNLFSNAFIHARLCYLMNGYDLKTSAQLSIMRRHISPELLHRIPDAAKVERRGFWETLSTLSKPFPLLDSLGGRELPIEVRHRIYGYAIEDRDPQDWHPAFLAVNRQIRQEIRPLYFERVGFTCDIWPAARDGDRFSPARILEDLKEWSRLIVRDCIRHLRGFEVYLWVGESAENAVDVRIVFHLSPEAGLSYHLNEEASSLGKESRKVLDKHVAHVEQLRQTINLQGESIILALVEKPRIWEAGVLRLSQK